MIETIAELLNELVTSQVARLDSVDLSHAPTIGAMYEGLSQVLLNRSLPSGLDLRVVSGFVHSGDSSALSPQIDCMLVTGIGEEIPYTSDHKWHVKDVIAVIEVKKNLYGNELESAIDHSTRVREVTREWARSVEVAHPQALDTSLTMRTFRQMTGKSFSDLAELSNSERVLFHTLVMEAVAPVRVVLGYHGFKNVDNLRSAYVKALESRVGVQGFGFGSLPYLVISGDYSLVKANGLPYVAVRTGRLGWPIIFSTSANPMVLLLEVIWSKVEIVFGQVSPSLWGLDLTNEILSPLVTATVEETEEAIGWSYGVHTVLSEAQAEKAVTNWSPVFLSEAAYMVVTLLCSDVPVSLDDSSFAEFLELHEIGQGELLNELLSSGLVSMRGNRFELITQACVCAILPDGRLIAGENNTGRVDRWITEHAG